MHFIDFLIVFGDFIYYLYTANAESVKKTKKYLNNQRYLRYNFSHKQLVLVAAPVSTGAYFFAYGA